MVLFGSRSVSKIEFPVINCPRCSRLYGLPLLSKPIAHEERHRLYIDDVIMENALDVEGLAAGRSRISLG